MKCWKNKSLTTESVTESEILYFLTLSKWDENKKIKV